jgi:phage tail-like protein
MPRTQNADMLMVHKFHLVDVSVSLPPVLLAVYGFSSITAPELTIEERTIKEGNFEYPRKVFQKASVNNITLSRGAQLQDNDFYSWIDNYLQGNREKKNLMLIQSTAINEGTFSRPALPGPMQKALNKFPIKIPVANMLGGITAAASVVSFGITKPGRSWVLRNCSPVKYKVASDFDARTSAISILELEISYEWFTEFNTGLLK